MFHDNMILLKQLCMILSLLYWYYDHYTISLILRNASLNPKTYFRISVVMQRFNSVLLHDGFINDNRSE